MSENVSEDTRRRLRNAGGRRALRSVMFAIEKLGIEHEDWRRVKSCIDSMIADLSDNPKD